MSTEAPADFTRYLALMAHRRFADAEGVARAIIGSGPDDDFGYGLLSDALRAQDRYGEAIQAANEAVKLAPDNAVHCWRHALSHLQAGDSRIALQSADRGIELDPNDPDLYEIRSIALSNLDRDVEAVQAAEAGLAINPEHGGCRAARSNARLALGHADDAEADLRSQLADDPNDDVVHCQLGQVLLTRGRNEEAEEHFREALRIDPNYDNARQGLITALKSRNLTFSLLLRFGLWLGRLPKWVMWTGFISLFAIPSVARRIGGDDPYVKLAADFSIVIVMVVSQLMVCADAIFTLALRLDKRSRVILSRKQLRASNWQILTLSGFVLTMVAYPYVGRMAFFAGCSLFALLTDNIPRVFDPPSPRSRRRLALLLVAALLAGLGAMIIATPYAIVFGLITLAFVVGIGSAKTALFVILGLGLALFLAQFVINQYVERLSPRLVREDHLNGFRDSD